MNKDLIPVATFKRRVDGSENSTDQSLEITINAYDQPVAKTPSAAFYTHFTINDTHGAEWGHGLLKLPILEGEAEAALNEIVANINSYKNK